MKNSLDRPETLTLHRKLIENKFFLKQLYRKFYSEFRNSKYPPGKKVELGSGGGFIKKIVPGTLTSDLIGGKGIDKVFPAEKIPFKNNSISAFFMFDVFHHIKDIKRALGEMSRCLKKGGKIVMIEPYNSLWGRLIWKNFNKEAFDPESSWRTNGKGRLSDANGALPWIVFVRDREIFNKKFPELKVKRIDPHTPLLYILSGGLSFPQIAPNFTYSFFSRLENFLSPLNFLLGMYVTVEIVKVS